jgi:cytochrome b561
LKEHNKNFTPLHRWLHWTIAIVISLSFITGFLHEFWMNKHYMANTIERGVQAVQLSHEHAIQLAETIRAPMWHWHVYAAYAMLFLFAARLVYMWIKGIKFPQPFKDKMTLIDWLEWLSYALFYFFVGINVVTGFYLLWGSNFEWKVWSATIHKWAIYWFPVFILLHFAGILIAEISNKKGITSKMIGGD